MNASSRGLADLLTATTNSLLSSYILPPATSNPTTRNILIVPLFLFLAYLALCRALRYRGERKLRERMGFPPGCGREALARMTNEQAHQIINYLSLYEIPAFHELGLQFGLFKTYGVESISKLLLATRNLTDPVKSQKRYEDTAALINEFMISPPHSERSMRALARTNFLHSKYIREGSITNEDLLYTLSVFVTEPARFARLYEWRSFNEMEWCAYGVFWKSVGDAMGIRYEGLLAGSKQEKGSWRDGIDFADDIAAWAKRYEAQKMQPSTIANKPARALIPIITYWIPRPARPFVEEMVCVLMGDRVREAFVLPEPGIAAAAVVYSVLFLRRMFLRYLALPRLREAKRMAETDPVTGRMRSRVQYGNYPFYVKPTVWNRWGPKAWAVWMYGGKLPGDEPARYMPQGYLWTDLGPTNRMGLGGEEMDADVKRMEGINTGGCPF
ncbi:hypothetical protein F5Y17DRAFT_38843 [Xylariaceae sp. FL0594]|nr:hypothetical protein F5Y17DRAFT_38843 [Xylariaceae sp. FL0594]